MCVLWSTRLVGPLQKRAIYERGKLIVLFLRKNSPGGGNKKRERESERAKERERVIDRYNLLGGNR